MSKFLRCDICNQSSEDGKFIFKKKPIPVWDNMRSNFASQRMDICEDCLRRITVVECTCEQHTKSDEIITTVVPGTVKIYEDKLK